ncbi:MAG: NTP transferase domain-containing protein [Candidatus Omnitrophica bacterium]|nr:NTP transferase domain-containing protein [Candidatus Omnitrophota bacterium]MBU1870207.1 NTP transferase domain-containing protein [Candidatus Omnitrophota bacterium]
MKKNIAVIILAAGKGTRMKSDLPKVLHPVCGRPMLDYVLDLVKELKVKETVLVLGYKHEQIAKHIGPGIKVAVQNKLLGTADAIKAGLSKLKSFKGTILVLYGDIPLLKKDTVKKLLDHQTKNEIDATILTAELAKPSGYGRILRDKCAAIRGIIEEKDADDVDKQIKEINTGIICFDKTKLAGCLNLVKPNNRKKEFYLTDIIGIFYKKGYVIESEKAADIDEALGINSRVDLARANAFMQKRINEKFMNDGVSIVDPNSAIINYGVKIGRETTIYPFTFIEKNVNIGKRCSVGPFVHLREGTELKDEVLIGNFLEITRSKIGSKTIAKHFSYIGDSRVGKLVNIGAGTVTANFDGQNKNVTVIKDGAFIGSHTVLVAPVKIGKRAVTGAGSVVLKNRDVADAEVVCGVPARSIKK